MDFDHFRKSLVSPALQAIAAHWDEARGTAPMPSWEQLKPSRMAAHLSILWAYKYDAHEDKFIGRLAGDRITWGLLQKGFRGITMDELWTDPARIHRKMLRVISEPAIYRKAGNLFKQGGRFIEGERIILPLAGGAGVRSDGLLGASAYNHPFRSLEMGRVELLDGDEDWFSVTSGASAPSTLQDVH